MTELKKGDRVRIYGAGYNYGKPTGDTSSIRVGVVLYVHECGVVIRLNDDTLLTAAAKQCRKLKKKERLSVWIPLNAADMQVYEGFGAKERTLDWLYKKPESDNHNFIEFKEVKKK